MKTLTNLVKGNLKSSKAKSVLICITIMLTTTLLTSVGIICNNWLKTNKAATIEYSGSFEGIYKRVNKDKLDIIKNNASIDQYGIYKAIGTSQYEDSNLGLIYADNTIKNMANIKFEDGTMPEKENEIAIESGYLNLLNNGAKIGDKIKLSYESLSTGEIKEKEFILSGILQTSDISKAQKSYSAIISKSYFVSEEVDENTKYNVYINIVKPKKLTADEVKESILSIAKNMGIEEYDVRINTDYINASNPDPQVIAGGIIVALIIILSSMLVIYSIFYVSVINKVHEYGKLRAVGATKRQIRKIILREGFILSCISIPLGIAIGYLIGQVVILKALKMDRYGVGGMNIFIAIGVAVITVISVLLSLLKPMKMACNISPVEAMRYDGNDSKQKKRKGYEEINLKKITFANLSRNKKRTVITLLSLSLSGILFIVASTIMNCMNPENMAKDHSLGDITVYLDNYDWNEDGSNNLYDIQANNPLGKEMCERLENIPGVKKINMEKSAWASIDIGAGEKNLEDIQGFDKEFYDELSEHLVEGEINKEALESGEGLVYTHPSYAKEFGIKVGSTQVITIYDGKDSYKKEFTVLALVDIGGASIRIPESVMDSLIKTDTTIRVGLEVKKDMLKSVEEEIKNITDNDEYLSYGTLEDSIETYKKSMAITSVLIYSLVIIIGVIGLMNLINTMITSIITRKRELGILQAIGLSDKQLVKMLQIEGLFYTVGTLLITLTLGNILGYIAVIIFRNTGASYAIYDYPLTQTIIMIVAITLVQILITYMVTNNFKKDSLVDRIRYSE
ncbi:MULTISPECIES: ABC transporter permease [Clostridia]|uniref:FtsX-like permease family protein n=2 Tax=Clostridia TaxID=186801 RepID=A0A8I0A4U8_9CLOT|nr:MULTISPECIES: FtsX-like permease family protein [Clostridia]MBC5639135.1 FtsX-like permease family protein [Clostridium lentum]MBC5653228.1 FtsX-like permease family protein [Blautia lenta]